MALYNDLARRDIIKMCEDLLKSKTIVQRDSDGKLEPSMVVAAWDVPWHHMGNSDINCHLWNHVMFKHIFRKLPYYLTGGKLYVPSGCMECFKVVVRPPTLKALFALVEIMKRLGHDCKAGTEQRPYVFGLYGGYFYNRGLNQGLERYMEVRQAVNDDPDMGPGVKVILKRACTEMEMEVGPSDQWELTAKQAEMERLVYRHLDCDLVRRKQSPMGVDYVHARWIEFAYQWGDETVFEYLDPDKPLYKPLVTYHHLAEDEKMTMHVVYLKDHDGHKKGQQYRVERSLGARLCEGNIVIPLSVHLENEAAAEKERLKAEKAKARRKATAEKKKAEKLLKEKETSERKKAVSKTAKTRSKSIKK